MQSLVKRSGKAILLLLASTWVLPQSSFDLAEIQREQRNYAQAEPLFKQCLEISRKALARGHPQVAWSLGNLGFLYRDQQRFAEAEPLLREALDIGKQSLGPGHALVTAIQKAYSQLLNRHRGN